MTFLLDTNVISELRMPAADHHVVAWVDARPASELFVSAMTLYELERGILARERKDPAQGALLRAWFTGQVLPQFDGRVLPVDGDVARRAAALSVPDARPFSDGLIAATALVHAKAVVTRDVQDFAGTGVAVVDPWRA